jgi:hypothetical protein
MWHSGQVRAGKLVVALVVGLMAVLPSAASARPTAEDVVILWNELVLELVRHTPTYSPPVASRAFAYLGITAYEAVASGNPALVSLAGQLNELTRLPERDEEIAYDDAIVVHAALAFAARSFFGNTGPTGQRAMSSIDQRMAAELSEERDPATVDASVALGRSLGEHIFEWSLGDGGAQVENLGFPYTFDLVEGPEHWVPTSRIAVQQAPLLPSWADNRAFAMPSGAACPIPPPPPYSEAPGSAFYLEALEVHDTVRNIDDERGEIARFWSDDPMLSPTPPGHWISIALDVLEAENAALEQQVDVLARLGIVLADAFIGCWHAKYQYDLLRPVTYINRHIDPKWQPLLITPPFPEYPSGHSTQSAAAAVVLTTIFGEDYAFADDTHADDGLPVRQYPSFWAAAEEAAISRLYGGIHFRSAIDRGLDQGRCIGEHTNGLVTWANRP